MDRRVKDWSTDQHGAGSNLSASELRRAATWVIAALVVVWLALFSISSAFPYVENGASSVGEAKFELARRPTLFDSATRARVYTFGNSQVLAGFQPKLFENLLDHDVTAFNLAIPGESRYVNLLEAALKAGNVPTTIFVQSLPSQSESSSLWGTLTDNKEMVRLMFPFKDYIRDFIVFAFDAHGPFGFARQYRSNVAQIRKVVTDQGYYFIKSQSHYPNDSLPSDYSLPTDNPRSVLHRTVDPKNPEFQRLVALANEYRFQVVLFPVAYRVGEYAAPDPDETELKQALAPYDRIHVAGPAYILMPPSLFSDPIHLNPTGAAQYTTAIAKLYSELPAGLK